jgi:hypothetical protein
LNGLKELSSALHKGADELEEYDDKALLAGTRCRSSREAARSCEASGNNALVGRKLPPERNGAHAFAATGLLGRTS